MFDLEEYKKHFIDAALKAKKDEGYIVENLQYAEKLFALNLPIIFDTNHFSMLVGISHTYIMAVSNAPKKYYRKFEIKKKNGKQRVINEALPNLKIIQMWLLHKILYKCSVSRYAKAYIPGSSIKFNVRFHRNQKQVLKLDIKDFFGSFKEKDVHRFYKSLGYSDTLCVCFTKLCVLNGSLPQGASTSAYLSNLLMKTFDEKLSTYCRKREIRYTRYADDMTFSGEFDVPAVINFVKSLLRKMNMELNMKKTKLMEQNKQQNVTGIVVNEVIQTSQDYRRNIRKEVYYIEKYGIDSHLKFINSQKTKDEYLKSLIGKINYALFINPKDQRLLENKRSIMSVR